MNEPGRDPAMRDATTIDSCIVALRTQTKRLAGGRAREISRLVLRLIHRPIALPVSTSVGCYTKPRRQIGIVERQLMIEEPFYNQSVQAVGPPTNFPS